MLTTGSITTETFSAALLGLEDLSLRVTAAALHVASNPEFLDYRRDIKPALIYCSHCHKLKTCVKSN